MPSDSSGPGPDAVDAQLRAQGFRTTAQRRLVLAAVNELGHASAEEVLTRVNLTDPAVNLSTVYRSLEVLEEVGLLRHTHIGHNSVTYHANTDASHLHVMCDSCGQVLSVPVAEADDFVERVQRLTDFRTDITHVALHGTCAACITDDPERDTSIPAAMPASMPGLELTPTRDDAGAPNSTETLEQP